MHLCLPRKDLIVIIVIILHRVNDEFETNNYFYISSNVLIYMCTPWKISFAEIEIYLPVQFSYQMCIREPSTPVFAKDSNNRNYLNSLIYSPKLSYLCHYIIHTQHDCASKMNSNSMLSVQPSRFPYNHEGQVYSQNYLTITNHNEVWAIIP